YDRNSLMPPSESPAQRLDSWKEIAAYLGRQVRTVQRWEKEEGLPVHRHAHRRQGSVFALRAELDAWRESRRALVALPDPPVPSPRRRLRRRPFAAAAAATAAAILIAFFWFWPRTAPPPPPPPSAASGRWLAAAPQTIPIGQDPRLIAVADDGASLAISDGQSGLVTVLDPRTFALRARLAASSAVAAMTWAHGRLYAAVQDASQLEVFDPARPSSVAVVPLPAPASDLALLPDQNRLYLALTYAGLAWLDLADSSLHRISTPPCPARLALGPSHKRLYVAFQCGGLGGSHGHDAVGVLDLATNTLTARFGGPPQVGTALAISPDASQAWVSQ